MKTAMTDRTVTSMPVVTAEAKVPTAKVGHLGQFGLLESVCDVNKEFVEAETETSMKCTFEFQCVAWRLDADCKLGMSPTGFASAVSPRTGCLGERIESFEKFQNCVTRISDLETFSDCQWKDLSYRDPTRTPKCTQRPHEDRASGERLTTVVKRLNS